MKLKFLFLSSLFFSIAAPQVMADENMNPAAMAAASQPVNAVAESTQGHQASARIRLYGQNQKSSSMSYQAGQKTIKVRVGSTLKQSFLSTFGMIKNSSLGIPQTEMVKHMKQYDGILSKMFYEEFTIPAGVPIHVHNNFQGLSQTMRTADGGRIITTQPSCSSDDAVFTAEAGKDYEAAPLYNSAACGVAVVEVHADGSTTPVN